MSGHGDGNTEWNELLGWAKSWPVVALEPVITLWNKLISSVQLCHEQPGEIHRPDGEPVGRRRRRVLHARVASARADAAPGIGAAA